MSETAFFFVGNCQIQYWACLIGAVTDASRYFLGPRLAINLAIDGGHPAYVDEQEFLAAATRVSQGGGRSVLISQQTARGQFAKLVQAHRELFTDPILIPHIHFKSVWPHLAFNRPLVDLSDQLILRHWDFERAEFDKKLQQCGIDAAAFAPAHWRRQREQLNFYSANHPNGDVCADVLAATLPQVAGDLPLRDEIITALRASDGIFQSTAHPISPRVADLLGLQWAQTEFYRAWSGLSEARPHIKALRRAVAAGQALLDRPEAMAVAALPHQSHFRARMGHAYLKLQEPDLGFPLLERAAIDLKGYSPLLQQTLKLAVKSGRGDLMVRVLTGVAPYVDLSVNLHSERFYEVLNVLAQNACGRRALSRAHAAMDPVRWLYQPLANALAAA